MKNVQVETARIQAQFARGRIDSTRAAKLAKRAKRAAINRGHKARKVWK